MDIDYPKGRCSLGEDCMCPAGELRPKYKCKLCGEQLHNVVQNCAAVYDDDTVMCKVGFGCNIQKRRARETPDSQSPGRSSSLPASPGRRKPQARSVAIGSIKANTPKKRAVFADGRKRGAKAGKKVQSKKTQQDWFTVCETYRNLPRTSNSITQVAFLRSELSCDLFTGTLSEQISFSKMLKNFDSGKLQPTGKKRGRDRKFEDIEKRLIEYLELRAKVYKQDNCGVSWITLTEKCLQFADLLGYGEGEFKASPGWLATALKKWACTEDYPLVIDAEFDEAIALLETEASRDTLDIGDNDEPEAMGVEEERPLPTFLEAEAHLEELRRYSKARKLPSEANRLLDRFAHQLRAQRHRASSPPRRSIGP
jgi:hypothetical protein